MRKNQKNHHYRRLLAGVLLIAALLLSAVSFAGAEQLDATPTPGLGLNTPTPTPKPTRTPKPTKTPKPTPTEYPFEPGLREDHEGHKIEYQILDSNDWRHTIKEYCSTCRMTIKAAYTEDHQLDAEGHCTKCSYRCKHDRTYVREVPADGGEKTWDGHWISYPGTEITVCYRCGKYLKYENTIIRTYHNMHTRYLMPAEWLPKDDNNHCADVVCLDCDVTFEATKYHDFTGSAPFEDDGDLETHTRQVVCTVCGYTGERREPHHFVHDSYRHDDTDGTDEGHIEVFRCDVCGALKYEKQPHVAGDRVEYKADGDAEYHTEVLECTVCGEKYERPGQHAFIHDSFKFDDDTGTHIDVQVCTLCKQISEEQRAEHKFVHIIWKSVSDTEDQETVRCNICGLEIIKDPVPHRFDGVSYQSSGSVHFVYKACTKCGIQQKEGEYITEPHRYNGNRCINCDHPQYHDGKHLGDPARLGEPFDETYHNPYCVCDVACGSRKCHAVFIDYDLLLEHTFDPVTMKCTVCGYLKEGCEHTFTYEYKEKSKDKNGHTDTGTCTKCGKEIFVVRDHDLQVCGATEWKEYNGSHIRTAYGKCTVCGYETERYQERKEHGDWKSYEKIDNQTHKTVCGACGYVVTEKHKFDLKQGTACLLCGCEDQHEHEYNWVSVEYVDDTEHITKYQCTLCGLEKEERSGHDIRIEYLRMGLINQHYKRTYCPKCMHIFNVEVEDCTYGEDNRCIYCRRLKEDSE